MVRNHGHDKRRVWNNLHLAGDPVSNVYVVKDVSMESDPSANVLTTLCNSLHRQLGTVYAYGAYGAYGAKTCHE